MPKEAFADLFESWEDNEQLSTSDLRLKAVTLLALSVMLRPSDIAPKGKQFSALDNSFSSIVFSTDQLVFRDDGGMQITFFGIKNDTNRSGFEVDIPKHDNDKLDPVSALKDYIARTECFRPQTTKPVFLSLFKPWKAIEACTIGRVLEQAIKLAGLDGRSFTAKSFRPTGATIAVENGVDPEKVMRIGRWKTRSVFFDHYVHSRVEDGFTTGMI
jgi:integrase